MKKIILPADQLILPNRRLIYGRWNKVCGWRDKEHELSGENPLWETEFPNGITDVGIHFVLDRFTDIGTPAALSWSAGLIDNSGFSGVADADTAASHTGWTELQSYDEAVRQALNFSAAASRTINDSVSFSINATVTIKGIFVISDNTKGGTTGTLFSTALFSGTAPSFVSGNTFTANYTLSD